MNSSTDNPRGQLGPAWGLLAGLALFASGLTVRAVPLTTLEYKITGSELHVTPAALSVPKGVAGSVRVELSGGSNAAPTGAFVEATLRGPSFPARRVIGQLNQALLLPPLPIVGDYQLDNIRLVNAATGSTLQEGVPSSVPIRVFDEVLVSRVTSRPLSLDEIREKGIVIDDKNFRAIEFEVGFVLDGKTIPVRFPVVAPSFQGNTEIIPAAELERRLAQAEAINNQLDLGALLPPELETARLNIDIKGINFQFVESSDQDLALSIPPIPALLVVPGNVGFLNQFFSVQIFTENAAPAGSGLSVVNIKALLKLPPGPDTLVSTNYDQPGDDPLRFARVGADKIIQPVQPIVRPGADGKTGTSDDIARLLPGEAGTGEFLVEGLQEGLHVMDLDLTADLEGLAAGIVKIKGRAAGSVLVRNPKFSLAFSHPRTVRANEPYDLYVTILNTSSTVANLVQVAMAAASISGGNLESDEIVRLGTILPGHTATAKFRIRSTRTGSISFSNLTTSDDSLVGRFRLRGGFDERGVALSPDTIVMPDYVTNLPPTLIDAANRVLGQALSVSTAGQLPPSVKPIGKSIVTHRVLELAEAGQRLQYGDSLARVLPDVLLDWQGARNFNAGFDQILREGEAGREWCEAVARHQDQADGLNAVTRLAERLPDLAGRGEPWAIFTLNAEAGTIQFGDGVNGRLPPSGNIKLAARYDHTNATSGLWFVTQPSTNLVFEWQPRVAVPAAELALALIGTNGTAQTLRWSVANVPARACLRVDVNDPLGRLLIDNNCDGTNDATVAAIFSTVNERPPALISVRQDPSVLAGRPSSLCSSIVEFPLNYGTVLAALFSKPMTQDRVNVPEAYTLENGIVAGSVQIQPGGRVALLNMRGPVGALRPRTMTVNGVTDPRGNALRSNAAPVLSNLRGGISLRGRVARADGSPAAGIPVTLTYYDAVSVNSGGCEPFIVRPAQVFTDEGGHFDFDFVVSGIPYSVSATDTLGLSPEAINVILESTRADEFQRSRLLELANSASAQNTLLADFAVGALTDVIAKAEGLDRALLRDLIGPGSPREGSEVPVALRFRGRGAVTGRVVSSDGVTPVSRVAVNLFPDPASRETGRGVFSDGDGRFAFLGVPLGIFSIEAASGSGLGRTVTGLIDQPGQTMNVLIALSSAQVARTGLTGRVTESDNATPHAGATVFVGKVDTQGKFCCVVAAPTTDGDGFWRAASIPADTYILKAVSQDGRRKGERHDISAPAGVTNFASVSLQGFGVVIGRVETATGIPVVNAIVAGGEQLVRTTNNGTFRLSGVPTGLRSVGAGVERSVPGEPARSTPAYSFPRLGGADVNVLPGLENFVVIRLGAKGSILGRVVDETGTNVVTDINVAMPQEGGFQWVPVNSRGEFAFEGLELKRYTVSAPAPPVGNTDVSGLLDAIGGGGSSDEIQAAIGEAFAIFTGAADPLLNGEGASFNPRRWGYTEVDLTVDGEVKNVTVQFLRSSSIAGTVVNGQGVPIGARVRLTGIGPSPNGAPITSIRGDGNSDPALGTFSFPRQSFVGSYGLQAASPFFPIVLVANGFTTSVQPDETNVVLQFPATRDVNGRLAGFVFNPDGSPAEPGVKVRIRSMDLEIQTRSNGFFDTQIALPALNPEGRPGRGYFVEAEDLVNASVGAASVTLLPGITNSVDIRLLGRGTMHITVLKSDGTPAAGASLGYDQGNYPQGRLPLGNGPSAGGNGQAILLNLFEGYYGVCASLVSGPTTLHGRSAVTIQPGQTNDVVIRLGPTATIEGIFVQRDLVTPVGFAQIAVGSVGFTTTDSKGFFRVGGLPLSTYRLTSFDPVTGVGAALTTVLSFDGQTNVVRLTEQSRGEIRGTVIASDGTSFAPSAKVTLNVSDGITPSRTVTTGPDGRFSFPGAAAGPFELSAQDPITHLGGANGAVLPENAAFFEINVALQPLAAVSITVLRPDGVTPATNASVQLAEFAADTSRAGRVSFSGLKLAEYAITASSRVLTETHSVASTNISLHVPGPAPEVVLVLAGVGRVNGRVFLSDGSTPALGALVTLSHLGDNSRYSLVTGTDASGRFVLSNVAVGPYEISARSGPLGARVLGSIAADGETDTVSLTVEPSATVKGRLVHADGITPVPGEDVTLTLPGRDLPGSLFRTGIDGLFEFTSVPLGLVRLQSTALGFNGIALRDATLGVNGQTNDIGNLMMDEDDPRVISAFPPDTATGVPITTRIELVFNEALRTNTVDATGVYLQGPSNAVPARVELLNYTNGVGRLVRLTPTAPLKSLTTYRVIVVDDVRQNAFGDIIGRGPQDLVGRPLVAPFLASFTTADNDPPLLISIFPTNNQIQIDPRTVMRLSFNEPIRETNFSITLAGTNGLVPGLASVGLNGLVLAFAPAATLEPNRIYTLTVSNIFDRAGNRATNEPFVSRFATLDTLGPEIATLNIVNKQAPVATAPILVEAALVTDEPGARVRFTQDFTALGSDTNAPFRMPLTLPASGSTTIRAIATDRFGNDGPFAELVINVVPNQPPAVSLQRLEPASGPVLRGEPFTLRVSASDDVSVTNVAVVVKGADILATNLPSGNATDVTFVVPTNVIAGTVLTVHAQAADFAGLLSADISVGLVVRNLNHRPVTGFVQVGPGGALEFDGTDDQVFGPQLRAVVNDFTLELWVNPTASHRITSELNSGTEAVGGMRYAIYPQHGQSLGDGNHAGSGVSVGTNGISVAEHASGYLPTLLVHAAPVIGWTHVAVVYKNRTPRLYVNGTFVREGLTSTRDVHPSAGISEHPPYGDFQGQLDEFRVWQGVRSEAELRGAMNLRLSGTEPGLFAYYRFDETNGTQVFNVVVNNNHLSMSEPPGQPIRVTSTAPVSDAVISTNTSLALLPLILDGSDPDGDPITALVTVLPAHGTIFQTTNGITPGAAITNTPTAVTSPSRLVLYRRQPGFTGRDLFSYRLNDGLTNSAVGVVQLELVTPPNLDTDGDGMPDGYEFANGLDPETNDTSLDPDGDGLTNLAEFRAGTNPHKGDTDGDGLPDGSDGDPLQPSAQIELVVTTYANVIDPVQLSFAPDGTLFVGRDNSGSSSDPNASSDAVKIHRVGPGGTPVTEYGSTAIDDPDGVVFDAAGVVSGTPGSVLVAGFTPSGGRIRAIRPDQSIAELFGPAGSFGNPQTARFDRTGRLLFLEVSVQKGVWASTGGAPSLLLALPGNASPRHIAVDANNRIYISDEFGVLRTYASNGTLLNASLATGLTNFYFDVSAGGFSGTNIWGVDQTGRLLEVNPSTGSVTKRVSGLGASCNDVTFGLDGALYVSQFDQDRILRIIPSCVPAPIGLIGWWRGEDSDQDSIGANRGTLSGGAAFAPGIVGQAFLFDGAQSRISIPDSPAYRFTNGLTMEMWFRATNTPDFSGLLDKFEQDGPETTGFQMSFAGGDERGRLRTDFGIGAVGGKYVTAYSIDAVMDGRWHHAAATWDGKTILLYTDGIAGSPVTATNVIVNNTEPILLGVDSGAAGRNFNGLQDEVSIYNRALSAVEIQSLYTGGFGGKCREVCIPAPPGLIHWYPGDVDGRDLASTNVGTLEGAVTAGNRGKIDGAFHFDGLSGGVNLGNVPDLDFAPDSSFSIEAWFNSTGFTDAANDGQVIVGLNNNCGKTLQLISLENTGPLAGKIFFGVRDANDVMGTLVTPATVAFNQFHHVVGVREVNGGTKMLRLFLDGALVASAPDPTTGALALNAPDVIGRRNSCGTENIFNGLIDDVSIYNRALTTRDVERLYSTGAGRKCPPICAPLPADAVAWWRAEDSFTDALRGLPGSPANGVSFAPGEVGRAFRFDGVDDEISLGTEAGNFGASDFTIEFWIASTNASRHEVIIAKRPVCDFANFWNIFLQANGGVSLEWCASPAPTFRLAAAKSINDGAFHHVAWRRQGTNYSLIVDGAIEDSRQLPPVNFNNPAPLLIGRNACVGLNDTFRLTGRIDELSIYQRALSQPELLAIYQAGSAGKCVPAASGFSLSEQRTEPAPDTLRIEGLAFTGAQQGKTMRLRQLALHWNMSSGERFTVEQSVDLIRWQPVEATVTETAPGVYTSVLPANSPDCAFFRLRRE